MIRLLKNREKAHPKGLGYSTKVDDQDLFYPTRRKTPRFSHGECQLRKPRSPMRIGEKLFVFQIIVDNVFFPVYINDRQPIILIRLLSFLGGISCLY